MSSIFIKHILGCSIQKRIIDIPKMHGLTPMGLDLRLEVMECISLIVRDFFFVVYLFVFSLFETGSCCVAS
jgi:hypothetical protein